MLHKLKNLFKAKDLTGYFFIHIPKTAGTSFITLLDAVVAENAIFPCQLWREINEEMVANKNNYHLLRGHFGGGSYKLLCAHKPHRLTILRHPQSLSLSTFHFIKREKNTAVHDLVKNKEMDLKAFLQEPRTLSKIENRMVRHLSFDLQQDPEAQELFLSEQSVKVIEKWIKAPKKISPKKRLARALKVIDECSWFGIVERFDESMQLFCYRFNLPPIGKSPRLNVYKKKQEIDEFCQKIIAQQNELDAELYNYASTLFVQKYQQMVNTLQTIFGKNDDLDALIDKNYQKNHNPNLKTFIDYDFSTALLGAGWNRREWIEHEQTFFRWTSSSDSYIDFWVQKKDYSLSIRIINALSIEHIEQLDIHVNNHSITYHCDPEHGVVRIISAQIPKSLIKNQLLRLKFILPPIKTHAEVYQSNDNRPVGLAINWIKLR